jgi:YVTN family beta-propeller protein
MPIDVRRYGMATDLAVVPGSEELLVATDRGVLFVPEASSPALGVAVIGALAWLGRRVRRRGTRSSSLWVLALALPDTAGAWDVVDRVPLFGGAEAIVVDSEGSRAFLSNRAGFVVLDVPARVATHLVVLERPSGKVEDIDETDGKLAFVDFGRYSVVDASDGSELFATGAGAAFEVVLANGFLFGPNFNSRDITIAALDGSVLETIDPTGGDPVAGPCGVARSPDRSRVFVADEFNESIYVIDTQTRALIDTLPVGASTCELVALDAATLFVTSQETQQAALLDASDPTAVPEPVFVGPFRFVIEAAADPLTSRAFLLVALGYFGDGAGEEIVVLDLDPLRMVDRVAVDASSDGRATDLAIVPGEDLALVTTERGVLFVREPGSLAGSLACGAAAVAIARRARGSRAEPRS